MKPWIKEMIKSTERGYLTISDRQSSQIIPYSYTYEKGHLLGSLDILQADLINIIKQHPIQHLLIKLKNKEVGITGKIFLNEGDLDELWKKYNSGNELIRTSDTLQQTSKVPHLSKRVVLDFVPIRMDIDDEGKQRTYEMEIL